jgi:hypothetical protein
MSIEFHTDFIGRDEMIKEMTFILDYFNPKGSHCKIWFGFAWGVQYYDSNEWRPEQILITDVLVKVRLLESQNLGLIGKDDCIISFQNLDVKFCNDGDLHIIFSEASDESEYLLNRWESKGFSPVQKYA